MKGNERREHILKLLSDCQAPLSGTALARQVGCSRQVVVQDIALLRASNIDIISTNEGYLLPEKMKVSRVFKVRHDESKIGQGVRTHYRQGRNCERHICISQELWSAQGRY